jgi:hypothetical protein
MEKSPNLPMTPPAEVEPALEDGMELPEGAEVAPNELRQAERSQHPRPGALAEAMRAAKRNMDQTPSEGTSASEEDYDEQQRPAVAVYLRRRAKRNRSNESSTLPTPEIVHEGQNEKDLLGKGAFEHVRPLSTVKGKGEKTYVVASDDKELQDILRRGLQRVRVELHDGQRPYLYRMWC